ncbi:MAG: prepilin-type N-terminal cleavage/methylation domain-containing protein [Candidatus Ryanbacteria bacterium]|nr:prepilin-type N-terminal cleavage/methylation domain-containing protein [Candidatus Ryanbacteria bacterium]
MLYKFYKKFHSGFTLIEIIVALAVLVTVIASFYGAVRLANQAVSRAADKAQAAYLLEEGVEAIRHIRDLGWDDEIKNKSLGVEHCLDFGDSEYGLSRMTDNVLLLHGEEKTGATSFVDSSGSGNTGTCTGSACPSVAADKFGNALNFDGNDYINVGNNASLEISNNITIEAWVNTTQLGAYKQIVNKNIVSLSIPYFFALNNLKPAVYLGGVTSPGWHEAFTAVTSGTWNHVAFSYNGSQIAIYVNGSLDKTIAVTGSITNVVSTVWVGSRSDGTQPSVYAFNGRLDGVAIYNRALSAEEIKNRARGGPPCRLVESKFKQKISFSNVCRNSASNPDLDDIIGSTLITTAGSACSMHGKSGTVDIETKLATTTVQWGSYSESVESYIGNLFKN